MEITGLILIFSKKKKTRQKASRSMSVGNTILIKRDNPVLIGIRTRLHTMAFTLQTIRRALMRLKFTRKDILCDVLYV